MRFIYVGAERIFLSELKCYVLDKSKIHFKIGRENLTEKYEFQQMKKKYMLTSLLFFPFFFFVFFSSFFFVFLSGPPLFDFNECILQFRLYSRVENYLEAFIV